MTKTSKWNIFFLFQSFNDLFDYVVNTILESNPKIEFVDFSIRKTTNQEEMFIFDIICYYSNGKSKRCSKKISELELNSFRDESFVYQFLNKIMCNF